MKAPRPASPGIHPWRGVAVAVVVVVVVAVGLSSVQETAVADVGSSCAVVVVVQRAVALPFEVVAVVVVDAASGLDKVVVVVEREDTEPHSDCKDDAKNNNTAQPCIH